MTREITAWAISHNTSDEIAKAIMDRTASLEDAERLWSEPTDEERAQVEAAAFRATDEDVLFWGVEICHRPRAY